MVRLSTFIAMIDRTLERLVVVSSLVVISPSLNNHFARLKALSTSIALFGGVPRNGLCYFDQVIIKVEFKSKRLIKILKCELFVTFFSYTLMAPGYSRCTVFSRFRYISLHFYCTTDEPELQ